MKELQIEQNLKDVEQQWETMRFTIQKHFRQTQERGFLISDVDGIIQSLEDTTLLLNGIDHSRGISIEISVLIQESAHRDSWGFISHKSNNGFERYLSSLK